MKVKNSIHILDYHKPVSASNVQLEVMPGKFSLPASVDSLVDANWKEVCNKNPNAKDGSVAYLADYSNDGSKIHAKVITDGFRFNQFFNRSDTEMKYTYIAKEHGVNPLASWILAVSNDGYALFGNKVNFGSNKVSGFGGFTQKSDLEGDNVSLDRYMNRVLSAELGPDLKDRVKSIDMTGLNFSPVVGPRGCDGVYVAQIDGKHDELDQYFCESEQFKGGLIPVKMNPDSLFQFLNNPIVDGNEMIPTNSCVGGVVNVLLSQYGTDALKGHEKYLSEKGVVIGNEPVDSRVGNSFPDFSESVYRD